jgi:hypothetical protein
MGLSCGLHVLLQEPLVIQACGVLVWQLPHWRQAGLVCSIVGALAGGESEDWQVGCVVGHLVEMRTAQPHQTKHTSKGDGGQVCEKAQSWHLDANVLE